MSKGNLFMGNASGKLADVVLYRNAGTQVARLRVRNPKNPRSEAQRIQRVIQSTASKAYSVLQEIANHAFEGKVGKTANQSEFMRLNVERDRYRVSVAPQGWRALTQFNSRQFLQPVANNYIVAAGSLPELPFGGSDVILIGTGLTEGATYQQVCDALGLQKGDQLTFVLCGVNSDHGELTGMVARRLILEPSDGDMSVPFLSNGAVNKPNEKNEMQGAALGIDSGRIAIDWADVHEVNCAAATVIVSRFTDAKWLRSTARLFVDVRVTTPITLGEAVDSWARDVSSDKYLNQATPSRSGRRS